MKWIDAAGDECGGHLSCEQRRCASGLLGL